MITNLANRTTRARTKGNGNARRGYSVIKKPKDATRKIGRWQFLTATRVDPRLVDDLMFNLLENQLGGWN